MTTSVSLATCRDGRGETVTTQQPAACLDLDSGVDDGDKLKCSRVLLDGVTRCNFCDSACFHRLDQGSESRRAVDSFHVRCELQREWSANPQRKVDTADGYHGTRDGLFGGGGSQRRKQTFACSKYTTQQNEKIAFSAQITPPSISRRVYCAQLILDTFEYGTLKQGQLRCRWLCPRRRVLEQ